MYLIPISMRNLSNNVRSNKLSSVDQTQDASGAVQGVIRGRYSVPPGLLFKYQIIKNWQNVNVKIPEQWICCTHRCWYECQRVYFVPKGLPLSMSSQNEYSVKASLDEFLVV